MDELIAFLTARLDEYEAAAYGLAGTTWTAKRLGDHDYEIRVTHDPLVHATAPTGGIADVQREDVAEWIATHHPRRAQREVAAKRAILVEHETRTKGEGHDGRPRCHVCTAIADGRARRFAAPCPTLRHLAAVWSDHPDYREDWG